MTLLYVACENESMIGDDDFRNIFDIIHMLWDGLECAPFIIASNKQCIVIARYFVECGVNPDCAGHQRSDGMREFLISLGADPHSVGVYAPAVHRISIQNMLFF